MPPNLHAIESNSAVGTTRRMSMANIRRGKIERPMRVLLYGAEGVGKSTFAAHAPSPVYLASEDGTSQLDVARLPEPRTWVEVFDAIQMLEKEQHDFGSFVIDTLDWLEPLCWAHVCREGGKRSIEDFPYGKGYAAALEHWRRLLAQVQQTCITRRMHLVVLAHSHIRKVDDPITGPYDRHMLKLHERAGSLWREALDAVLFARVDVYTVEKQGRMRAYGNGTRVVHTTPSAAYDAKNRFNLPETMPLSWDEFYAAARASTPVDPAKLRVEIEALIDRLAPFDLDASSAAKRWLAGKDPTLDQLLQARDRLRAKITLATAAQPDED
jgi:hypothetical protein